MKDTTFRLRLTSEDKAAIEAAASREGRSASDWALRLLLDATSSPTAYERTNIDRVLREPDVIYNPPVPIVDAPLPRSSPILGPSLEEVRATQTAARNYAPFTKSDQAGRKKR